MISITYTCDGCGTTARITEYVYGKRDLRSDMPARWRLLIAGDGYTNDICPDCMDRMQEALVKEDT